MSNLTAGVQTVSRVFSLTVGVQTTSRVQSYLLQVFRPLSVCPVLLTAGVQAARAVSSRTATGTDRT